MVLSIPHPPNLVKQKLSSRNNYLLSLLPQSELNSLLANSERTFLLAKTILYKPKEPITKVYFPLKGIISLLNTFSKGLIAEVMTIGQEGMVGIASILGGSLISSFTIVQTDCVVISLDAKKLYQEFYRSDKLQSILLLYTQTLLSQISQNVFCSCHHTIEQRLARWLLAYSDRLETKKLLLTQENLADILGVRRSSLSVVANEFRKKKLIDYSRGRIILLNTSALRKIACKCDRVILDFALN